MLTYRTLPCNGMNFRRFSTFRNRNQIMSNEIQVFYHIWNPAGGTIWQFLVDEQIKRLFLSGLPNQARIRCSITAQNHEEILSFVGLYPWVEVIESTNDESEYEGRTLKHLYRECTDDPSTKVVCYFHTKGIRYFSSECPPNVFKAINSWRHFLEWGTIDRWKDAVAALSSHDVAGVNYKASPWPHMSGNFWWSTAGYVRGLIDPVGGEYPHHPQAGPDPVSVRRLNFERWIGLNNPNVHSFYGPPFKNDGIPLNAGADLNLYMDDIEPYYRRNGR